MARQVIIVLLGIVTIFQSCNASKTKDDVGQGVAKMKAIESFHTIKVMQAGGRRAAAGAGGRSRVRAP